MLRPALCTSTSTDQRLRAVLRRHRAVVSDRRSAGCADRRDDLVGRVGRRVGTADVDAQVVDDHPGPAGGEELGVGPADTAPRTRHDSYPAGEVKPRHDSHDIISN
jgi:hypothetical protein